MTPDRKKFNADCARELKLLKLRRVQSAKSATRKPASRMRALAFHGRIAIDFHPKYFCAGLWVDGEGGRDLADGDYSASARARLLADVAEWFDHFQERVKP